MHSSRIYFRYIILPYLKGMKHGPEPVWQVSCQESRTRVAHTNIYIEVAPFKSQIRYFHLTASTNHVSIAFTNSLVKAKDKNEVKGGETAEPSLPLSKRR
jgi:hypothetical protein